ncbi:hypothetical protein RHAL1_03144 [Beijerinckiaceae bacterium RH AL1]|nr:hypothetical protein RHAL1_03144 [Beijerinckiaceae bacterium RH AL1]
MARLRLPGRPRVQHLLDACVARRRRRLHARRDERPHVQRRAALLPAGTPDLADIGPDGRVDFEGSILRELAEETGLASNEVALEPTWQVVRSPRPAIACLRVARATLSAEALQARLQAHNASHAEPELTRLVPVRSPADLDPARMPDFMLTYLAEALG